MLPVPKLFSLDKISIEGKALAVVLSCKNSENELVQAATAIVQEEDVQGCQYLLQNCKKHPEMHEFLTSPETTCFYAGEQEAMAALAAETPRVQQRWCLRHIVSKYTPDISPVRGARMRYHVWAHFTSLWASSLSSCSSCTWFPWTDDGIYL